MVQLQRLDWKKDTKIHRSFTSCVNPRYRQVEIEDILMKGFSCGNRGYTHFLDFTTYPFFPFLDPFSSISIRPVQTPHVKVPFLNLHLPSIFLLI